MLVDIQFRFIISGLRRSGLLVKIRLRFFMQVIQVFRVQNATAFLVFQGVDHLRRGILLTPNILYAWVLTR